MDVDTPIPNGHAHTNGTAVENAEPAMRFASGLILPPPDIKSVIDRTAWFVARSANPPSFEEKIREGQRSDPKFSFLNPADPYHAYYRDRLAKVTRGEVGESGSGTVTAGTGADGKGTPVQPVDIGVEPPQPDFILDMPNISAVDLDTMKLTALFTAQRGTFFLSTIAQRESQNPQFEFLRPNHSLFGYFNRLVEQYTKVLKPSKELLEKVKVDAEAGSRWRILELAQKHAKWERNKQEKDKKRKDDQEAERIAFAEIDWHDYAIVQTIEFTAADANAELPMPMSVQEVENMTLAQKRMAAAIMETTADDVEAHKAKQAALEAEAAAAVSSAGGAGDDEAAMEESDNEDEEAENRRKREEEERKRELERAQALRNSSTNAAGPMKIRTDYVPKLGAKNKAATTTCAVCGQEIPVDELQEHMRIELLDPKWKSQRDAIEARKAQASELQRGANVGASLKNLARTRVDIFGAEADEERRKKEEEEERERRKEREKVVWDGHTATKVSTMDKFSTNVNFDEQIAAIHRAKGLGPQEANAIGPGIGPAAVPAPITSLPAAPASLPPPPVAATFNGPATVASGPQPASAYPSQPPVMLPPLHYQGLGAPQPFGYQPPPASGASPAGVTRTADQMEGQADDIPPAKKQRVNKLLSGQLYPESDWIQLHPHPISLRIQLPDDPSKPEWKLDGTIIEITDLPVTFFISTLRDRFIQKTGSTVSASSIRLSYQGKMLPNAQTLAYHNLEDEDLLVLTIATKKKK